MVKQVPPNYKIDELKLYKPDKSFLMNPKSAVLLKKKNLLPVNFVQAFETEPIFHVNLDNEFIGKVNENEMDSSHHEYTKFYNIENKNGKEKYPVTQERDLPSASKLENNPVVRNNNFRNDQNAFSGSLKKQDFGKKQNLDCCGESKQFCVV